MSLVNTITVDLSLNELTLTSTNNSAPVETIQFSEANNTVTFGSRAAIALSSSDFMNLLNQLIIFEAAIIYNFNPGSVFMMPFNSFVSTEVNNVAQNIWTLVCNELNGPPIISYSASLSSKSVSLIARPSAITIPFSEWADIIASLKDFQASVGNYLGVPL
jgi:hypothetical protein